VFALCFSGQFFPSIRTGRHGGLPLRNKNKKRRGPDP
jgi:hypothetical protein